MSTVRVERRDGLWIIGPEGAPTVLDDAAGIDVLVLEVAGGHLTWSLLSGRTTPAAVIDDRELAQEWVWAVYGADVALALDEFDGVAIEVAADPGLPELAARARRLGYARWAARWWPASALDGIAPLDERLLDTEIADLSEECELLVDGSDAPQAEEFEIAPALGRAEDYALAAGPATVAAPGTLVLARGVTGWDWRRCPPGLLDASERAVSWEVARERGETTVRVRVVAAPLSDTEVPAHLRPRALIRSMAGGTALDLVREGELWVGSTAAPAGAESGVDVEVYVPGIGVAEYEPDAATHREQVRALVADRLRHTADTPDDPGAAPLLAEIAAAAGDSDF